MRGPEGSSKQHHIQPKLRDHRCFPLRMPSVRDRRSDPFLLRPVSQNYSALHTPSACARPATVGWPRQACRTWRPPRPSTLTASQLGCPTARSPRPASRALPPLRPEHFANGVRSFLGSHNGVVFVPVRPEPLRRFNIMAAPSVTGVSARPRASAPASVQSDAEGSVSPCSPIADETSEPPEDRSLEINRIDA